MINKIKKIFSNLINIKNYKYIKNVKKFINIILFLRYIFIIFGSFLLIYLLIPKTFDYSKRMDFIENALSEDYNLEIKKFSKVSYQMLPTPRLNIKESRLSFAKGLVKSESSSLIVILPYLNLYNYEKLKIKKILLKNSKITYDINKSKLLPNFIKNINNKILITNSLISFIDKKKNIINLKNFNFHNKKNNFYLNALLNNLKIVLKYIVKEDRDKLIVTIPDIGSQSTIVFLDKGNLNLITGNIKSKNLDNNFQFNFKKEKGKAIEITNSLFRNSFLGTSFDGIINTSPYFNFNLILNIKNINNLKSNFYQFLANSKDVIKINKMLNGQVKINYLKKNYQSNYLNKVNINAFFENGNLILKNSYFEFIDGHVTLSGILKDYKGYQYFDFEIISQILNVKKFLKKIAEINIIGDQGSDMKIKGDLNITSRKINFSEIVLNNNQSFEDSDINNFKEHFENLIIKDSISGMFEEKKIKLFLKKIYE